MTSNPDDTETSITMTTDEAVIRAKEIAARLSGQSTSTVPSVQAPAILDSSAVIVAPAPDEVSDDNPQAEGYDPTNLNDNPDANGGSKKRKRWGVMPVESTSNGDAATDQNGISPVFAATDAAAEARAKALAAVAKAIAPGALLLPVKPKIPPVTKRVWVSTTTMITDERPAAHFVAYGQRHFVDVMNDLNKDIIQGNESKDEKEKDDLLSIEFKGKGASDKPPILGMPEEPLHVHIHGPKLVVDKAEITVEDILEAAKTAPLEEEAINARLAAEGALTTMGGASYYSPENMQETASYRPASVAQLIGQANIPIEQRIMDSNAALIEETIGVPNGIVGYIIGRGGENIASMQAKTGCKVQIQKEHDLQPGQTERQITLQAISQEAINECRAIIENMVADRIRAVGGNTNRTNNFGNNNTMNNNTSFNSMSAINMDNRQQQQQPQDPVQMALSKGHKVVQVHVPDADVGLVIGKGGVTIKSIQEQTGSAIQVPKTGNVDNPLIRTLQITNPSEQGALMAKEMVENVLKTKPGYEQQMQLLLQNRQPASQMQVSECSIQVMIPDKDVGLCIGKQGCVIKYLQNTTRTKIQIPPHVSQPGDIYRTATIIGPSMEACNQVRQTIERIVAEQSSAAIMAAAQQQQYENGGYYNNNNTTGMGGYGQQYQQQQYGVNNAQDSQQGYSAEWAAYHAAVAAQEQQSIVAAAAIVPQQQQSYSQYPSANVAVAVAAPTATVADAQQQPAADAYYEQFFRYAYYYGEDAARQYYGAWAPPVGTPNPYGHNPNIQPAPTTGTEAIPASTLTAESVAAAAAEARETSRRNVSNLPAWMSKK